MNLAESLTELNEARKQLEDSLASDAADPILLRRACRVILRLCAIVYAVAITLRDTRVDLATLRSDFDSYAQSHP